MAKPYSSFCCFNTSGSLKDKLHAQHSILSTRLPGQEVFMSDRDSTRLNGSEAQALRRLHQVEFVPVWCCFCSNIANFLLVWMSVETGQEYCSSVFLGRLQRFTRHGDLAQYLTSLSCCSSVWTFNTGSSGSVLHDLKWAPISI